MTSIDPDASVYVTECDRVDIAIRMDTPDALPLYFLTRTVFQFVEGSSLVYRVRNAGMCVDNAYFERLCEGVPVDVEITALVTRVYEALNYRRVLVLGYQRTEKGSIVRGHNRMASLWVMRTLQNEYRAVCFDALDLPRDFLLDSAYSPERRELYYRETKSQRRSKRTRLTKPQRDLLCRALREEADNLCEILGVPHINVQFVSSKDVVPGLTSD